MRERVNRFWLQPTPSFGHGPQRELFVTDEDHETAALMYAVEWRAAYVCRGCENRECPQCAPTVCSWLQLSMLNLETGRRDSARFSHPRDGAAIGVAHHTFKSNDDLTVTLSDTDVDRLATRDCVYRYTLTRELGGERVLACCGLNPSTASAFKNDPTIRRDIGFARAWGFGRVLKVNADAYRDTDPKKMKRAAKAGVDIVGPENDLRIREACELVRETNGELFVAWGTNIDPLRQRQLADLFADEKVTPMCWDTNDDGSPQHELYAPSTITLREWTCP